MDSSTILNEISQQVSVCQLCDLHLNRKKSVPGEGPANAEIMLIGEGPGFYENEQGRPFVGAAGKFLSELLGKVDLKREDVFITNVVKCRPPDNRDPLLEELTSCRAYLERQIETIDPQIIVTLGRFSMAVFLPLAKIGAVHGQARLVKGKIIVPMYHPAAALHQPLLRPTIEKDFSTLKETLRKVREARQPQKTVIPIQPEFEQAKKGDQNAGKTPPTDTVEQLKLF